LAGSAAGAEQKKALLAPNKKRRCWRRTKKALLAPNKKKVRCQVQEPLGNAPRRFCPNPLPYGKLKKSSA